jgi:hypothetical protein
MKTQHDYKSILKYFVSDDEMKAWMLKPFNSKNKTFATNSCCMLVVPFIDGFIDRTEKVGGIYPIEHKISKSIFINEIKEKLAEFPLVDSYDVTEIETECDACDGNGIVDFEFYHKETHTLEHDCPICDGKGVHYEEQKKLNGKKEIDSNKYFKIGVCVFHIDRIKELILASELLNECEVVIVNQDGSSLPTLFKIGEVELLLMPCYLENKDEVFITIEI